MFMTGLGSGLVLATIFLVETSCGLAALQAAEPPDMLCFARLLRIRAAEIASGPVRGFLHGILFYTDNERNSQKPYVSAIRFRRQVSPAVVDYDSSTDKAVYIEPHEKKLVTEQLDSSGRLMRLSSDSVDPDIIDLLWGWEDKSVWLLRKDGTLSYQIPGSLPKRPPLGCNSVAILRDPNGGGVLSIRRGQRAWWVDRIRVNSFNRETISSAIPLEFAFQFAAIDPSNEHLFLFSSDSEVISFELFLEGRGLRNPRRFKLPIFPKRVAFHPTAHVVYLLDLPGKKVAIAKVQDGELAVQSMVTEGTLLNVIAFNRGQDGVGSADDIAIDLEGRRLLIQAAGAIGIYDIGTDFQIQSRKMKLFVCFPSNKH